MDKVIKNKSKKKYVRLSILLLIILAVYILFKSETINFTPSYKVKMSEIIISTVKEEAVSQTIPINAKVIPVNSTIVETSESGQIEIINKKSGSFIRKGEVILTLFNYQLDLEYSGILEQLDSKRKYLNMSKSEYEASEIVLKEILLDLEYEKSNISNRLENEKKLFNSKSIAKQTLLDSEKELDYVTKKKNLHLEKIQLGKKLQISREELIHIEVNSLKKKLDNINTRLDSLKIRAPSSGTLNMGNFRVGEYIGNRGKVAVIDENDNFKLNAYIDEFYLSQLSLGDKAHFKQNSDEYNATVSFISPEVKDSKFLVEFQLDSQPESMRSGQSIGLKLINGDIKERIVIDNGGFIKDNNGAWIFKLVDGGVEKVPIKTGIRNSDFVEILSGIDVGDRVIVSSYKKYKDYEKLIIEEI